MHLLKTNSKSSFQRRPHRAYHHFCRKISRISIDSSFQETEEINILLAAIKEKFNLKENYSVEIIGSSLGEAFFSQMIHALLVAFLLMSIVVFIYFRTFIPSVAVIAAAFSDIVVTLVYLT